MSVARFIADQRTNDRVPHAFSFRLLGMSESWFYTWLGRPPTPRTRRRDELDAEVRRLFDASEGTYGSPRIHTDLLEAGWRVGVNTVADSMRRQGLAGRKPKRPHAPPGPRTSRPATCRARQPGRDRMGAGRSTRRHPKTCYCQLAPDRGTNLWLSPESRSWPAPPHEGCLTGGDTSTVVRRNGHTK